MSVPVDPSDQLTRDLAKRMGMTPVEMGEAIETAAAATEGLYHAILMARYAMEHMRMDLYLADQALYETAEDGGIIPGRVHPEFLDFASKEGKARRDEYDRSRRRFTATGSEMRRNFERAAWFSTILGRADVEAAREALTEEPPESGEPAPPDVLARLEAAVESAKPSKRKRGARRRMKKELQAQYAELEGEGAETFARGPDAG